MNYTRITENIMQIADDEGVFCTLIKGSKLAVLVDTGYGRQPLAEFVKSQITTDLMVINSHGHPDHIGGNNSFDAVYAHPDDHEMLLATFRQFAQTEPTFELRALEIGQIIDLGGVTLKVVPLFGHTKGSIGLLDLEERILIAGDALNPCLWMFDDSALTAKELIAMIDETYTLPFDRYLFGHSDCLMPKEFLMTIRKNAESMRIIPETKQDIFGWECYSCKLTDEIGTSEIVFSKLKI